MLANNPLYITVEDYLAAEEISPIRHEYRNGEVFAMTGGTLNHNAIVGKLAFLLRSHLLGSGCSIFTESVKTRIDARDAFYYPDLVVTCDDRDRPSNQQFIEHPCLIVEVLSPSTARFDRTEKFADYRTIPTLTEYLLVSTDRQQVEQFQRDRDGNWHLVSNASSIHLASLDCPIAIGDLYAETDIAL